MFFFFPFAVEPAAAPASKEVTQLRPLPMLPAPRDARRNERPQEPSFGNAVFEAANLAVDFLRRAINSIASSLTALGSRTNALFAQVAANLAFERAARDTASSFGMNWPALLPQRPGNGLMPAAFQAPSQFSPFGFPAMNPWAANPLSFVTEAIDMWTSLWMPAPQRRNSVSAPAPVTASFALPGFAWSFTLG